MKYALTFGQKYDDPATIHPVVPEITGRSYFVIEAANEQLARIKAIETLGLSWAFLYAYDEHFEEDIVQFNLVEVTL